MIRKATTSDINAIVRLEKQGLRSTLGAYFIYNEIVNNPFSMYMVYELHGQVIGYIGYHIVDDKAEILNFVIGRLHQGNGYGSQLMEETLHEVTRIGVKMITLEVRVSNIPARHLYEKFGFKQSHKREKYYKNEDAIVYLKEV